MTRALGPRVGLGYDAGLPLGLLGLCWLPVGVGGVVWVAGHAASWLSGHGWAGPAFDVHTGKRFLDGGPGVLWPGVDPRLTWGLVAVLMAAVVLPVLAVAVRARGITPGDPLRSWATLDDVRALGPADVAARARRLRPSLLERHGEVHAAREDGVLLGRLKTPRGRGPEIRASWEDVVLAVMAPRAGKTTALAVPAILDAPGPVVATSNKAAERDLDSSTRPLSCGPVRACTCCPRTAPALPHPWWRR